MAARYPPPLSYMHSYDGETVLDIYYNGHFIVTITPDELGG